MKLEDGYTLDEHCKFVGQPLPLVVELSGNQVYMIRFSDEAQEAALLSLIRSNSGVKRIAAHRIIGYVHSKVGEPPQSHSTHQVKSQYTFDVMTTAHTCRNHEKDHVYSKFSGVGCAA